MKKAGVVLMTMAFVFAVAGSAHAANGAFKLAWGKDVVLGAPATFELCTVASTCTGGLPGAADGAMKNPKDVAVAKNGTVYVADWLNDRISEYGPTGAFIRTWGKDVIANGGGSTGFEICDPADGDVCKTGVPGDAAGEMNTPGGVAIVETIFGPNVVVMDSGNVRAQKFLGGGTPLSAWGRDVVSAGPSENGTGAEICRPTKGDTCKTGVSGGLGGELGAGEGIAVGGGHIFIARSTRIDSFNAVSSVWERAWGKDVLANGGANTGPEKCVAPAAALCQTAAGGAQLGGEIAAARYLTVDASDGDIYVAENDGHRVQNFQQDGDFIRMWGGDVVSGNGNTDFEVCNAAATCKAGVAGGVAGELQFPAGVATDAEKNVYVSGRSRISKYSETGVFRRAWGQDVVDTGPDNSSNGTSEICVAGIDVCQANIDGEAGGSFNGPGGIATNTAGDLYVADENWHRIQLFSDAVTGSGAPVGIAPPAATRNPRAEALKKCKKKRSRLKRKKCRKRAKKLPTSAPAADIPR